MNDIINLSIILNSVSGYDIATVSLVIFTAISIPALWWYGMGSALKVRKSKIDESLSKLPFKFESFLKIMGGDQNILKAKAETSKVKIWVHDIEAIDLDLLKSLKSVSGTFKMSDSVTLIMGRTSKTLANKLNELNSPKELSDKIEDKKS